MERTFQVFYNEMNDLYTIIYMILALALVLGTDYCESYEKACSQGSLNI